MAVQCGRGAGTCHPLLLASVRFANKGTRAENGDLIHRTETSRGAEFVPSGLQLREVRPEKAVLSAGPHASRAARDGSTRVYILATFWHSLTLATPPCA